MTIRKSLFLNIIRAVLMIFGLTGYANLAWAQTDFLSQVQKQIEQRIGTEKNNRMFVCHSELICGIELVPAFYTGRGYKPAWIESEGPRHLAGRLVELLQEADAEGLNPGVYHLAGIKDIISSLSAGIQTDSQTKVSMCAELDILLTDAYLFFGSHLLSGRINPETIHTDWVVRAHRADLMKSIKQALSSQQIEKEFEQLKPPHFAYTGLRDRLRVYRKIRDAGGWPQIPPGPSLRPGVQSKRVMALRSRLEITGDLIRDSAQGIKDRVGADLMAAVGRFQQRHGLKPDGIAGKQTIAVMNISASERVRQIELNMERWRWIPHDLGARHLFINTAEFSLKLVDQDTVSLAMRVVVGKPFRKTPVFSADMTYLDLNPYWNIPTIIAVRDILPAIRRDDNFLAKNHIRVFKSWSPGALEMDPIEINWQNLGSHYFPYKLRQDPGPKNALGRIKFMFPNKFAVYIHDTPHRALFNETIRGFSSGCIRAEKPIALASQLLIQHTHWTPEQMQAVMQRKERQAIRLKQAVPVHLLYLTAWVDAEGRMRFRRDIYNRDPALDLALQEKAPRPTLLSKGLLISKKRDK